MDVSGKRAQDHFQLRDLLPSSKHAEAGKAGSEKRKVIPTALEYLPQSDETFSRGLALYRRRKKLFHKDSGIDFTDRNLLPRLFASE
jgi:hypothetical protein